MPVARKGIAPDRPGLGLSDLKRGRKILDWPADVIELADALQIARFAVVGISGGGPYSEPDRQLLDQPEVAAVFVAVLQEAFRSGFGGANQDAALYTQPWGFRPPDISTEVHLWHGGQDANVPVSAGRHVADAVPNCRANLCEREGHLTPPHSRIREILKTLVS
jgi:pimeloyl-ACP methyl ester carboxylesterase